MRTKIILGALSLSSDALGNSRLKLTLDCYTLEFFAHTFVNKTSLHLKRAFATRPVAAPLAFQKSIESPLSPNRAFFMKFPERDPVQNHTEQFHDSESEDVFDLYNACNGIVRDGFLDVEELNRYTPDEAKELNVPRLREIWEHTRTGCPQCRDIVQALHTVRCTTSDVAEYIDPKDGPELDIDQINSIS